MDVSEELDNREGNDDVANFFTDDPLGAPNWLLLSATVVGGLALRKAIKQRREATEETTGRLSPGPSPGLKPVTKVGQDELRFLAQQAGLDDEWIIYFEATAAGESGFNNLAAHGDPSLMPPWAGPVRDGASEAKAARIAYDRNAKKYAGCAAPVRPMDSPLTYTSEAARANRYSFGSGGWFAELPANFVAAFKDTKYHCIDPWSVFDPAASLVMAIEYSRRVMRRTSFKANPTWVNLRVGHANPSAMNDPEALNRQRFGKNKFGDRLEQIGQPSSFMDRPVTPLPSQNPVGMLEYLEQF